jgi:hypothetical protein
MRRKSLKDCLNLKKKYLHLQMGSAKSSEEPVRQCSFE